VAYDDDSALDLLTAIDSAHDPGEVVLGSSVRHLAAVAAFATDLVARGRLLPTVVRASDGPLACWRPLLIGPDADWIRALALALPPVTRSPEPVADQDAAGEGHLAASVLGDAVDALVDAAARAALPEIRQLTLPGQRGGE